MSAALQLNVSDQVSPALDALKAGLGNLKGLHEAIGLEEVALVRNHLIAIAESRHATATRLGAVPSGHWAQAVEKTSMKADAAAATVTIRQPGIGRAMHDVDIVPTAGKKYLTLPNLAAAYNKRAASMKDSTKFVFGKKGPWAIVPKAFKIPDPPWDAGIIAHILANALYLLRKSVHQRQDRTLLPTDQEFLTSAKIGGVKYIDYLLLRQGKGAA